MVTRMKEINHQLKRPLINSKILSVSILGSVERAVWRMCILIMISGCRGFDLPRRSWVLFSFEVYQELNRLGMNVVVLNQNTGAVTARRRFDTYSTNQESTEMMEFISGLPDGRILCLTVKVFLSVTTDTFFLSICSSMWVKKSRWFYV